MDCTYKTNKYGMPLFNCVGMSAIRTTFEIGLAFTSGEDVSDYEWVLECLAEFCGDIDGDNGGEARVRAQALAPQVVVSDADAALMKALSTNSYFKSAHNILCIWHIHKNIGTFKSLL